MPSNSQLILTNNKTGSAGVFSYLSFILVGIVNTCFGLLLPFLSGKLKMDDNQAGYFLAAQSLGGMCGTFITSLLFSKLRSRTILLGGFCLMAFSLAGLNSNLVEIVFSSSLLNGISIGIIIPTTTLVISRTERETRASAINTLNFFWAFGAIISPLLFYNLNSQLRFSLLLITLIIACSLFFVLLFKQNNFRLAADAAKTSLGWADKFDILIAIRFYALTIFLQIGVEATLSGWLATYSKRLTDSELWLLAPAIYWLGFLSSRLISSFYLRYFSEQSLILYGLSLVVSGLLIIISANNIYSAASGAFLAGFGTAPIFPTIIALVSAHLENKAPELISYLFLLSGLSGMFFLWLIGYIATVQGGLKTALFIPLTCAVILFIIHFSRSVLQQLKSND